MYVGNLKGRIGFNKAIMTSLSQSYIKKLSIDDFRVSDVILLGGANSDQNSRKCRGLACDVKPVFKKIVRI